MTHGESAPVEYSDLIDEIVQGLLTRTPENWRAMEYVYYSTVGMSSGQMIFSLVDGTSITETAPLVTIKAIANLRRAMYEPGKGTWFTATFFVNKFLTDGSIKHQSYFDYDCEPIFPFSLSPRTYIEEMERFPRDEEHIPDWLRAKIQEARAEEHG